MVKKMTFEAPVWVAEIPEKNALFTDFLMATALIKMCEYKNHIEIFEKKYKKIFNKFEKEVNSSKRENFKLWDDYISWKGYQKAYEIWKKRYESTVKCMK